MIALIVAYSKNNRVIGKNGSIPWKIKGEQKRFKELTMNNYVIMGRKTYEDIGKPLPNRYTIVVSKKKKFKDENCTTVSSLREALNIVGEKDAYIAGGAKLYEEAIEIVDKMYISIVDIDVEGDTFFPKFDESLFQINIDKRFYGKIPYVYTTYTRLKK